MTNQQWLSTIDVSECYEVLNWLFFIYARSCTVTETAVKEWLAAEFSGNPLDALRAFFKGVYERGVEGVYESKLDKVINTLEDIADKEVDE